MSSLIDPFQLATCGVGPGFTTFNMATCGFGFEIEVIIQPVQPSQGGGGGIPWDSAKPYEIIVRIKYKGKVWEERRFISALMIKGIERVSATYKSIVRQVVKITAIINNIMTQKINVRIIKK